MLCKLICVNLCLTHTLCRPIFVASRGSEARALRTYRPCMLSRKTVIDCSRGRANSPFFNFLCLSFSPSPLRSSAPRVPAHRRFSP